MKQLPDLRGASCRIHRVILFSFASRYELHPMTIRLVDFFGGPAFIKAEDYFAVKSSDVVKIRNVIVT